MSTAKHELELLREEARKLDKALNDAEISPNGDDYNRLYEIVAGGTYRNDVTDLGR
jgi:hypothetical protein